MGCSKSEQEARAGAMASTEVLRVQLLYTSSHIFLHKRIPAFLNTITFCKILHDKFL